MAIEIKRLLPIDAVNSPRCPFLIVRTNARYKTTVNNNGLYVCLVLLIAIRNVLGKEPTKVVQTAMELNTKTSCEY